MRDHGDLTIQAWRTDRGWFAPPGLASRAICRCRWTSQTYHGREGISEAREEGLRHLRYWRRRLDG